jgi:hypothetical protein
MHLKRYARHSRLPSLPFFEESKLRSRQGKLLHPAPRCTPHMRRAARSCRPGVPPSRCENGGCRRRSSLSCSADGKCIKSIFLAFGFCYPPPPPPLPQRRHIGPTHTTHALMSLCMVCVRDGDFFTSEALWRQPPRLHGVNPLSSLSLYLSLLCPCADCLSPMSNHRTPTPRGTTNAVCRTFLQLPRAKRSAHSTA